jgi:uncharacterized protein (TIGR02646 family)
MYCSYCERRMPTNLAVEHIQPKGLSHYKALEGRWDNFLLGCVNCNSTKGDQDVVLADYLIPDRDNTAAVYEYALDGKIEISTSVSGAVAAMAKRTLAVTGLDKRASEVLDANGQLVAIDRFNQRMEVRRIAEISRSDLAAHRAPQTMNIVANSALGHGHFSIWMDVFEDDHEMRHLLIERFKGTARDCFDSVTSKPVSPRPHTGLADGSKV